MPVRLNTNENPYPPQPAGRRREIGGGGRRRRPHAEPLPGPGALALRADLAALPRRRRRARARRDKVWAANGSNEVMLQLLQAFGGPGRTALSLRADVLDVSASTRADTHTRWVARRRARDDFTLDLAARRRGRSPSTSPSVVLLASPNNPTGTALPLADDRGASAAARRASSWSTRPTREFRRAGAPSALPLLAATAAAGRDPDDVARRSRSPAAGSATSPRHRRSSTRCASSGCPITCPR